MGASLTADTIPATCTGIRVTVRAGKFPAAPAVTHCTGTFAVPAASTWAVAAYWMPPGLSNKVPAGTVPVPVTVTSPRAKVAAVRSSPVLGTI